MVRGVGTEEMVAVNLGCGGWVYQVKGGEVVAVYQISRGLGKGL